MSKINIWKLIRFIDREDLNVCMKKHTKHLHYLGNTIINVENDLQKE